MPLPHGPNTDVRADLWNDEGDHEDLGRMTIESGCVVVCDAGALGHGVSVTLPAGDYLVRIETNGRRMNVSAVLLAKDGQPIVFERVGHYPVEAGMSGFFDQVVHDEVSRHDFPISVYDDLICDHLDPAEDDGHAGAFVPFEDRTFSACRSGAGDGVYAVYVGRDERGAIAAVVTTF